MVDGATVGNAPQALRVLVRPSIREVGLISVLGDSVPSDVAERPRLKIHGSPRAAASDLGRRTARAGGGVPGGGAPLQLPHREEPLSRNPVAQDSRSGEFSHCVVSEVRGFARLSAAAGSRDAASASRDVLDAPGDPASLASPW